MTRTKLLDALNLRTGADCRPVSPHALEDWVREGLVSGPVGRGNGRGEGVDWQWSETSLREARRVCFFQNRGLRAFSGIRAQLWLNEHREMPIDQLRRDFAREFRRVRKRVLRQPTRLSSKPIELRAVAQSARNLLEFGIEGGAVSFLVRQFSPEFGLSLPPQKIHLMVKFLQSVLGNLAGDPAEVEESAEAMIGKATSEQWSLARIVVRQAPWLLTKGMAFLKILGLGRAPPEITRALRNLAQLCAGSNFRLVIFAAVLAALAREDAQSGEFEFIPAILPFRRMLARCISESRASNQTPDSNPVAMASLFLIPSRELSPDQFQQKLAMRELLSDDGLEAFECAVMG